MVPLKQIKLYNIPSPLDNDHLLTEILLHLPTKSLIRFKSVCKKWLSLISSDYFCRQHTLRGPKLQQSLILRGLWSNPDYFYWKPTSTSGENAMIPYTMKQSAFPGRRDYEIQIVQACNGLLLLISSDPTVYVVYNPTTGLSSSINIPARSGKRLQAIALAFDPSKSPYYKIVSVMSSSKRDDDYRVEVYDSEGRNWNLSSRPFTLPSRFEHYGAQYYNNAIFWWLSYDLTYFYFDIAKNEMKEFCFPQSDDTKGRPRNSYLQELDGNLYYLRLTYDTTLELWELGGDDKWILKHDHVFDCEEIGKCVRLMHGDYSDGSLQLIYYQSREMKMRAYNFLRHSFEDLVDFTAPPFNQKYDDSYKVYAYILKAFQFGETLALV